MPEHFIPSSTTRAAGRAARPESRAGAADQDPAPGPSTRTGAGSLSVAGRDLDPEPAASSAAPADAPSDTLVQYDIHQLAAATHLSVRTIRAHQTRGLLAPPRRQGRRVVYGRRHLDRLERIKALQQEGYNLAAIAAQFLPSRVTVQNQTALRLLRRSAAKHPVVVANLLKHGVVMITPSGNIEIAEESPVLAAFELVHLGFEVSDCVYVLAEVIDAIATAMPGVLRSIDQTSRGPGLLALALEGEDADPRMIEVSARMLTEAFRISLLACAAPSDDGAAETCDDSEPLSYLTR